MKDKQPAEPPPWEAERPSREANQQATGSVNVNEGSPSQVTANVSRPDSAAVKTAAVRGVIGPLEPDEAGQTLRRNSRGVEYVIFKVSQNGSATPIYCNRPELLPEIARRQGREAAAQVAVSGNNGRRYYVLDCFVEG